MSQRLDALAKANAARLSSARVKGEIAALESTDGARRVAGFLRDPGEAGAVALDELLRSIRRFGTGKVARLLDGRGIRGFAQTRRVREFTARQREVVASDLEWWAEHSYAAAARRTA
jgi:hypothetical protein